MHEQFICKKPSIFRPVPKADFRGCLPMKCFIMIIALSDFLVLFLLVKARLRDFEVGVTVTPPVALDSGNLSYMLCTRYQEVLWDSELLQCDSAVMGRYVLVRHLPTTHYRGGGVVYGNDGRILTICELEVYGRPGELHLTLYFHLQNNVPANWTWTIHSLVCWYSC